jgi:hypothetical protein
MNKQDKIKRIAYRLCKLSEDEMSYYLGHYRKDLKKRFINSLNKIIK